MTSLRAMQMFGLASLAIGIVCASFTHRLPKHGWLGVTLLLVSALAWALIDRDGGSLTSSLPMFTAFLFIAPIAVVYSFRVRRAAPDRTVALAAFVGSFLVAAFLLFMLAGLVYSFFAV
jgi:hypothetical membrane protein